MWSNRREAADRGAMWAFIQSHGELVTVGDIQRTQSGSNDTLLSVASSAISP